MDRIGSHRANVGCYLTLVEFVRTDRPMKQDKRTQIGFDIPSEMHLATGPLTTGKYMVISPTSGHMPSVTHDGTKHTLGITTDKSHEGATVRTP